MDAELNPTEDDDQLYRFTFVDFPVRGQWVRLKRTIADAHAVRSYPAAITDLLNQMFAAVAMFADNLKFEGAVALQSRGEGGALIRSLAECRDQQYLRGIAHLEDDVSSYPGVEDLSVWLGAGQLALSLLPPPDAQQAPYQGLVELTEPDLAANLEHYLAVSEQLPSKMFLASTGDSVSGLLLQRLPSADSATEISAAADDEAWSTIVTLAATITAQELQTLPVKEMLRRLFSEYTCRLHPPRTLAYRCTCSRQKSDRTLRILDPTELTSLLEEQGQIHVDCEFCGTRYPYDAVDIGALLGGTGTSPPGGTPH